MIEGKRLEASKNSHVPAKARASSGMYLNTIFYGPPGTGKTYEAIRLACRILTGKYPEDPKRGKEILEENVRKGRLTFVSFHQNYGYEEFVEGIRPELGGKELVYELRDGVFKR